MTTRTHLTPKSLALEARRISGDIDNCRWELAELAAQARADNVPEWSNILGKIFRRAEETVEAWARTWEFVEWAGPAMPDDWINWLPYSFYELASKRSACLGATVVLDLLAEFHVDPDAKYEAFRAQLSTLAGGEPWGDFPAWARRERKRIADWIDRAPSKRAADCLRLAAAAIADALTAEKEMA